MSSIALLHVAKRDLGLDDEDYRAVLLRTTGKRSASDMNETERSAAVAEFRRLGFKPSSKRSRNRLEGKYAPKLQALWIGGWNLGVVRNRNDAALLAFVKRQTGIDHTRFLHHAEDAAKAIEALKGWLAREAGVDWAMDGDPPPHKRLGGYRIAWAQYAKLMPEMMPARHHYEFWSAVHEIVGKAHHEMAEESDWQPVMNEFGRRIRAKAEKSDA